MKLKCCLVDERYDEARGIIAELQSKRIVQPSSLVRQDRTPAGEQRVKETVAV